jgi:hypothetical protein
VTSLRLASFADTFPEKMRKEVENLAANLEKEAGKKLDSLLDEPVATGALRASRTLQEGKQGLRLGWTEVHSVFIDMGRKQSKQYRRKLPSGKSSRPFSRLLGSDKVKDGFTQPAIKGLRLAWDEVVTAAGGEAGGE